MLLHVQRGISKSNNTGFTLIEVMVALLIFLVGLLGLVKSLDLALQTNQKNEMRTQGTMMGESYMVQIRNLPFANITGASEKSFTVPVSMRSTVVNYTVTKKIDTVSSTTKRVNVGVSWTTKGNRYDHVVSTVVTDPQAY